MADRGLLKAKRIVTLDGIRKSNLKEKLKHLTENGERVDVDADEKIFENRIGRCKGQKLDPFLSPHEAAQYLGVSSRFVYERIARKEMRFQRIGRLRRIRLSTLENWLIQQNNGEAQ